MSESAGRPRVAGIGLSHPDRVIYPELRITKIQLARYYDHIARWIVPHVRGRPLTLVHCPAGISGPRNYLKHAKAWGPAALRRVNIREKAKIGEYLVADSIAAVVALAQMGVVEIHTWNSTDDDVDHPNRIVWDLDPGPEVAWPEVVVAARLLRDVLSSLGLASWIKTTGGHGLHDVVPVRPSLEWSECLDYSRRISDAIVRVNQNVYTTTFSKRGRERKILFDYLRNNRTNTSICAYSPRARRAAPVSVPLDWSELGRRPGDWSLLTVPRRLHRLSKDPWAEYWTSPQTISKESIRAVRRL